MAEPIRPGRRSAPLPEFNVSITLEGSLDDALVVYRNLLEEGSVLKPELRTTGRDSAQVVVGRTSYDGARVSLARLASEIDRLSDLAVENGLAPPD